MRKRLLTIGFVIVLGLSANPPAKAIFGLSACEKIKKDIASEEKVGLEFHKSYKKQLNKIKGMSDPTWKNVLDVLTWLPDVYDSDNRVYKFVDQKSSCFTVKQIARARSSRTSTTKEMKDIASLQEAAKKNSNPNFLKLPISQETLKALLSYYPNYYSFLENKKLD